MDEVKIARIILTIFFIIGVIYSGFAIARVSNHTEKTIDLPASISYINDKTYIYTYTFDNISYNGTKAIKKELKVGDEIEIKINPEKPFSSELKEIAELSDTEILTLILTIATFIIGLIILLNIEESIAEICGRSLGEILVRFFIR